MIVENDEAGTGDELRHFDVGQHRGRCETRFRKNSTPAAQRPVTTPLFDLALDELNKRDQATAPLLTHWKSYSPNRKNRVLQHILNDEKKTLGLLFAIDNKLVLPGEIGAAFQQLLKQHSNKTIREQAAAGTAGKTHSSDQLVNDRLAKMSPLKGDRAAGEIAFATHCAACHKLSNTGNAAGPDLAAIADKSPRALLTAILNPNQAVEDRFGVRSRHEGWHPTRRHDHQPGGQQRHVDGLKRATTADPASEHPVAHRSGPFSDAGGV